MHKNDLTENKHLLLEVIFFPRDVSLLLVGYVATDKGALLNHDHHQTHKVNKEEDCTAGCV